jgi:hypothetical protein
LTFPTACAVLSQPIGTTAESLIVLPSPHGVHHIPRTLPAVDNVASDYAIASGADAAHIVKDKDLDPLRQHEGSRRLLHSLSRPL